MKITCNREKFQSAFSMAAAGAASRSVTAYMMNVKLSADRDQVSMHARDNDSAIMVQVDGVVVERPGEVILPREKFTALLRELTDETISLDSDSSHTIVKGERSRFKLQTSDPSEFPVLDTFPQDRCHELPARFLREMIRRTLFAADEESSRYALGGVLFEMQGDEVIAVGTDGRRLARMQGPSTSIGEHRTVDQSTIIPARSLRMFERCISAMLSDTPEAVARIAATERRVMLQCERVTLETRLAEGRFPRWREVIPNRPDATRMNLLAGALHTAVRQAAIATSEESRGVVFQFEPNNLILSAKAAEIGDSRVELPFAYDGPEIKITLDPKYLRDFLGVLDPNQSFSLDIKDPESAALCSTDDGYDYVIMPLASDR